MSNEEAASMGILTAGHRQGELRLWPKDVSWEELPSTTRAELIARLSVMLRNYARLEAVAALDDRRPR